MTISYTYDADGLRTSQSIPSMSCTYQYVGSLLRYETRGDHKFYYFYDPSGNLASIRYCDANGLIYTFYALTNAQGDVIAFYNESGTCVVTYEYDAWGNVVKKTDTSGINFSEINMIRYRGYYYDSNSGLYYLQSRYYNPKVGRFLNADDRLIDDSTSLELNPFSYCVNNPVNKFDPTGHSIAVLLGFGAIVKSAIVAMTPILTKALGILIGCVGGVAIGSAIPYVKNKVNKRVIEKADAKIRDTIKENSNERYWSANVKPNYVDIGRPLTYNQAVSEVINGNSVFAVTSYEAKAVARAAGGTTGRNNEQLKPEIDSGKENTKGYYYHYHTYNRKGGHVYYLFE